MPTVSMRETMRSFGLILLSVVLLPFSFTFTTFCSLLSRFQSYFETKKEPQQRKTILVTGVGMAKGLTLARAFHLAGHRVIGADFERRPVLCSGRFSKSISVFHMLEHPDTKDGGAEYVQRLTRIVKDQGVDLWISCSGVASAVDDAKVKEAIEQQTSCQCIQLGVQETSMLHEKDSFMRECKRLGLPVPDTHTVASKTEVLDILTKLPPAHMSKKFILKPIGVDDAHRGNMTLLPLNSVVATETYVSLLPISADHPWILQEFIPGGQEYCTHALVVRGEIKCFTACPSAELLMHYKALPRSSPLHKAMLAFTREFLHRSENPAAYTGHMSFDFMLEDSLDDENIIQRRLLAIECNPRAHTAVVLFAQDGAEREAMVEAYLTALHKGADHPLYSEVAKTNGLRDDLVVCPPETTYSRYWIGHDFVALLVLPLLSWMAGMSRINHVLTCFLEFLKHVLTWKEGTFELWDPWPAFVLYHWYWPSTIFWAWWKGHRWSRANVSTTKMFAC